MRLRGLYLLILSTHFTSLVIYSQQLPQFTQYMFNMASVNPAYAGSRGALNATLLHRNQWVGLEGSPTTNTFAVSTPLRFSNVGLGLSYINDKLGYEASNYVHVDFSYSILFTAKAKLAFGLKTGIMNYDLEVPDANDPYFNNVFTKWSPNFGAGLYLSTNMWYMGVSAPRILNTTVNEGAFKAIERNSYYIMAGTVHTLSENLKFKPTALAKLTNGAPASYDFSASLLFNEKLWIGASIRFNDTENFGLYTDFKIHRNLRIGYAFDQPTAKLRPYLGGTHELILIFEWKRKDLRGIKSPRYF